jgi:hypothetical protein
MKKFKHWCRVFCFLVLTFIAFSANSFEIYKTTSELKFRKAANSKSHSLGIIKKGEEVNVIEKINDEWYKVEYSNKIGYLSSKYLQIKEVEKKVVTPPASSPPEKENSSGLIWFLVIAALIGICVLIMYKRSDNNDSSDTVKKKPKLSDDELREELKNSIINNIKITMTTNNDSIIDVTGKSLNLTQSDKTNANVPFWSHRYVYSYSEINSANNEQKEFYKKFKADFINGKYLDLEGNNNYAFILLFDLQNEYNSHKDISKLEAQLELLGDHYPKTKSYGASFLMQKMQEIGDTDGILRIQEANRFLYRDNSSIDYDTFNWRNKYKTKLNLSDEDAELLQKIWFWDNNFSSIEFCCIEILKLYIATIKSLKEKYSKDDSTTLENEFMFISDIIARKQYKYKVGSNNYKYCIDTTTNELYSLIFKYCENAVREYYSHKRKINTDTNYTVPEVKAEIETRILLKLNSIFPVLITSVKVPDSETEIALNAQNTTRWKIKYDELVKTYKENPKTFIENIISLGNLNKKNPSIENIFFEASKFISKFDKESALTLYIYYIYYDLKSNNFDNKQLTKTIQKNLFSNDEQLQEFENIVNSLIKSKKLEQALASVPKIYEVKRKKIQLNKASIKTVQKQHSGTVELLNEYLSEEDEIVNITKQENKSEEINIKLEPIDGSKQNSIYTTAIAFKPIHIESLDIFAKNSFTLLQSEFETFAKSKNAFKNQLIESINEICYDFFDDVLIEEEDNYYTINPEYYKRLLIK